MHEVVDDGGPERKCAGAVPYPLAISTFLQLQGRLLPESGTSLFTRSLKTHTNRMVVLAPHNHLLLLRAPQPRPPLPHLLPATLFAPPRRVVRTLARTLLMAARVCLDTAPMHGAHVIHGLPRVRTVEHFDLHLEQEEPRHVTWLPGAVGLQSAVPTMGIAGLLVGHAWYTAKGRDVRHCCRPQYVPAFLVLNSS